FQSCWLTLTFRNRPHEALCLVRVYALYGKSRIVLGFLLGISLGAIINACLMMVTLRGERYLVVHGIRGYTALSWTGVLVFDLAIFSLTLYKAFEFGRGGLLWDVIVRDGASS
ncbi:hypothetical protein BGW80DRAFT_1268447, partial [Lactifluus volemus]